MKLRPEIGICSLAGLGIVNAIGFALPTSAQPRQSFSNCVLERAGQRHISTREAIGACQDLFAYESSANEPYSTCVSNLSELKFLSTRDAIGTCKAAFYGKVIAEDYTTCVSRLTGLRHVSANYAKVSCQEVFQNAARPRYDRQPQPRRTVRRCFHVTLGQIWDDVHCQAHVGRSYNSPFEWRTFYVD